MPEEGEANDRRAFFVEPRSLGLDALRYGLSLLVVAAVATGLVVWLSETVADDQASEVDSAVMVELPATEASPASQAADGPEQQAAQASVAQQAPEQVVREDVTKDVPKAVEEPKPVAEPVDTPPPVAPDPAAVLERKREEAVPPTPVAAPTNQAQEERAPVGSDAPNPTKRANDGDEGRPHASKHAITLWQRSLMQRIETAKRVFAGEARAAGTVKVAFSIGRRGELASERVLLSSGSVALDRAALLLVKKAAPFPAPPVGSDDRQMSFIVPIRFR